MPKTIVMRDEYERPQRLVGITEFVPAPTNHDPLRVRLETEWLAGQVCPEHPEVRDPITGKGYTHIRVKWARMPWNVRLWGVQVQFVCPQGAHVWGVHIRPR